MEAFLCVHTSLATDQIEACIGNSRAVHMWHGTDGAEVRPHAEPDPLRPEAREHPHQELFPPRPPYSPYYYPCLTVTVASGRSFSPTRASVPISV